MKFPFTKYLASRFMILILSSFIFRRSSLFLKCPSFAVLVSASSSSSSSSNSSTKKAFHELTKKSRKIYRTVQVQVIHRHGDRSPITPMKDERFWQSTLVPDHILKGISSNIRLIKPTQPNNHKAGGRGPFGKLTELGLLQMIQVGNTIRDRICTDKHINDCYTDTNWDDNGNVIVPYIFHRNMPLCPANIKVFSTNFPRSIQSVQGLLVSLFPDGTEEDEHIDIDVRNTEWMIPDPQPRNTKEQELLEDWLSTRDYISKREKELESLAIRTTKILHPLLASDAHEIKFGVEGNENQAHSGETSIEIEPLGWNQLAEIIKCLSVRNILPKEISKDDQDTISRHAAWRWFENLNHPRLAYLSMNRLVSEQVQYMNQMVSSLQSNIDHNSKENRSCPPLVIWSAHDSTLIGLLCAYCLEMPAVWPEYASYLIIELIEEEEIPAVHRQQPEESSNENSNKQLLVRFSLNGEILKSQWNLSDSKDNNKSSEGLEMIPLSTLSENIQIYGASSSS